MASQKQYSGFHVDSPIPLDAISPAFRENLIRVSSVSMVFAALISSLGIGVWGDPTKEPL